MKCKEVRERLRRYVKGKLESSAEEVAQHLETCEECREKEAFFRSDGKTFLEAREYDVPEGLFGKIMEGIREKPSRNIRSRIRSIHGVLNRSVPWSMAALFIVIFLLGLILGAWGVSISNRSLVQQNMSLARQLGGSVPSGALPTAATASAPYGVRIIDSEGKLIGFRGFDSKENLQEFISKLYESVLLQKDRHGPVEPGKIVGTPDRETEDTPAKLVRYE
jgi:hypothetical protein